MYETYAPIWCQTPTFVKSAYREYLIRFLRKFFIFGANLETFIKSLYYWSCMTLVSVCLTKCSLNSKSNFTRISNRRNRWNEHWKSVQRWYIWCNVKWLVFLQTARNIPDSLCLLKTLILFLWRCIKRPN